MKGIVFNLLEAVVRRDYGEDAWDDLLDDEQRRAHDCDRDGREGDGNRGDEGEQHEDSCTWPTTLHKTKRAACRSASSVATSSARKAALVR